MNDEHVEESHNLDIIMNMYNLIKYSDNYSACAASLYHYKRQEQNYAANGNVNNVAANVSTSFEYKFGLLGNATAEDGNAVWKNAQIIVPLKYVSSFFSSSELPSINTKLYTQLNYTKYFIMSDNAEPSTFKITKTELYVPVVTLKIEDNNKLNKLLDSQFKRTVYWNQYKSKTEDVTQAHNDNNHKRTLLDIAVPGINRLFVMGFNDNVVNPNANPIVDEANRVKRDGHRKYFLPRVDSKDYNVLTDGRDFYDQNISDDFKKYKELRKVMTGRGEDFTTGSLLDYDCWKTAIN